LAEAGSVAGFDVFELGPTFSGLEDDTDFLKPKYAPTKHSGNEIRNQSVTNANIVPKGMALDDPLLTRKKFKTTIATKINLC
jgi:hypothetical protein